MRKKLNKLKIEQNEITDAKHILKEEKSFFENL
jgi:hypothetical protein